MLTYLLAILAACANATSSVLQRKANRKVPRKQNLSPRLIRDGAQRQALIGGPLASSAVSSKRACAAWKISTVGAPVRRGTGE